jgi:hypothetical protein
MTKYISSTETAKLIRAQLKKKFPNTKFSVRTDKYAGGSSIRVEYVDGPPCKIVEAVTKPFAGAGFDGMIDMQYSAEAFLLPDGSAAFAQTSGTEGSGGSVPKGKAFMPVAGAERVHFCANYVFVTRRCSERLVRSAVAAFARKWGEAEAAKLEVYVSSFGCGVNTSDWEVQQRFYEVLGRRMIAA